MYERDIENMLIWKPVDVSMVEFKPRFYLDKKYKQKYKCLYVLFKKSWRNSLQTLYIISYNTYDLLPHIPGERKFFRNRIAL